MLKSLKIKDFQSHVASEIPLGPGLNIISGPSGNGKSAILRAVAALAYNNLQGTSAVRLPNGKSYQITLETEGGTVVREKGKKVNTYTLNDTTFADVGINVPEAVSKLVNIDPVQLDSSTTININFANQMDAPFMLTVPDTAKMKFLNAIAGTNAVDLAAKEAVNLSRESESKVKEANTLLEIKKASQEQLLRKIEHLKNLNKYLATQIETYEALKLELDGVRKLHARLESLKLGLKRINRLKAVFSTLDISSALDRIRHYINISSLNNRKLALENSYRVLHNKHKVYMAMHINESLERIKQIKALSVLLNKYKTVKEQENLLRQKHEKFCILDIGRAVAVIKQYSLVSDLQTRFTTLKSKYLELKKRITEGDAVIKAKKQQYAQTLQSMKMCPVCKQAVTEQAVRTIIEEL